METFPNQLLSLEERSLFEKVRKVIDQLPMIDLGLNDEGQPVALSCHILCRAVGQVFGLKWVDGYFKPAYCHSWLLTSAGNIIDAYPVGVVGGPILWIGEETCWHAPSLFLFQRRRLGNNNICANRPWMRRSVRRVAREISRLKSELERK